MCHFFRDFRTRESYIALQLICAVPLFPSRKNFAARTCSVFCFNEVLSCSLSEEDLVREACAAPTSLANCIHYHTSFCFSSEPAKYQVLTQAVCDSGCNICADLCSQQLQGSHHLSVRMRDGEKARRPGCGRRALHWWSLCLVPAPWFVRSTSCTGKKVFLFCRNISRWTLAHRKMFTIVLRRLLFCRK